MKKLLSLVLMTLLSSIGMFGQSMFDVSGTVVDKATGEAVVAATMQLMTLPDSSYVEGTMTGAQGEFCFKNVKKGSYVLRISYIGYVMKCVDVDLSSQKKKKVDIGYITMTTDDIQLKGVEVTAHAAKVMVSGDSLVYNASAYRVPEGSTLEALVKQLPGAKVDKEGNITINGKTVSKILVDGKEFFLNDKEVAMKNIPTEMIDKLKTYDRKSDLSRVTGIDDGEEETVLDLTVKKGMKNGWYGNVNLGAGTKHRYAERFNVNRFNDDFQATLLGSANNVSDMGFGGGGGRWGWGEQGLRSSKEIGGNFATAKPKLETGGSIRYRYDGSENENKYKHKERLAKIQHPRAAALTTKDDVDAEEKEVEDDEATGALGEAETKAEGKTINILHLPFILQQILFFCPLTYFDAMLTYVLSMFGALCFSRVRADYFDRSVVEPTIFVAIEGDAGSGKSKFREIFHKLFSRVIQLDKEKINKEEDDKRNIIQTVGVRTTMAKFLKLLENNCGVHMFDFESEVESVVSAIKSKNNYIDYEIIRLAFDNDDLTRMTNNLQIKSKIRVNYSFTGTNGGFEKFINKDEVEGGSASRFCWCNIPPLSEVGPLEMNLPKEFEMEKIRDDIDEYRSKYCYVTDADGNDVPCRETKVDISYLFEPLKKWNEQQQKMCEKDKSYSFYLRFANIAFRCGMILHMLYGCPGPEQEKERQNITNVVLYLADYYMSSYVKKFGKVDNKVADHSAQQQVYITDTRTLKALHDMKDEKGQSMYGWDALEKISGIPASTIHSRVNKLEEDLKDNKEK